MNIPKIITWLVGMIYLLVSCTTPTMDKKQLVDYVNPYIGNISHLLVPTFPTIHLPNSMLRVYPERTDYTADKIKGLPIIVTNHREHSAFNLSPYQGNREAMAPVISYTYDHECIKPYFYSVYLDEPGIEVSYAPSHQSALYELKMNPNAPAYLIFNSQDGEVEVNDNIISGYQTLKDNVKVYIYMETDQIPLETMVLQTIGTNIYQKKATGKNACVALYYGEKGKTIRVRYGISFISVEQAHNNLRREIKNYDITTIIATGRDIWNQTLGKIQIAGCSESDKELFYTSLYRCYERPVCLSEDGFYFSASDKAIHDDNGIPFYTDDWIWDTYRAAHPLRVLLNPKLETDIISSYIRMAEQMDSLWMPTFPEITGDSRRMNSNHAVAIIADACAKGLVDFDVVKAFSACKQGIENKTLAPWSDKPAGWLNCFYKKHGYIPALASGEQETLSEVHPFEKRQPVAVTLGTAYDEWCLSQIAHFLGDSVQQAYYLKRSSNYRNLFNPKTLFFHPKDKRGNFIEPLDYRYSGGMGAREYYGENNGWIYRWDVPHNIADLITLMGGRDIFNNELDKMFNEPLGRSKFEFYAQLPDHTGNVGQFSMANEPSLHIPYLYNYSGQPWKTQKRISTLLREWFRNDLMGMPGDEDGGGMTAFVVFSMMGFYPVTPGLPVYNIGSPLFKSIKIDLGNSKSFEIKVENYTPENKYIQAAILNGKKWDKPWFAHSDLVNGELILVMGNRANQEWGSKEEDAPPASIISDSR